jgi:hypothetical protein
MQLQDYPQLHFFMSNTPIFTKFIKLLISYDVIAFRYRAFEHETPHFSKQIKKHPKVLIFNAFDFRTILHKSVPIPPNTPLTFRRL